METRPQENRVGRERSYVRVYRKNAWAHQKEELHQVVIDWGASGLQYNCAHNASVHGIVNCTKGACTEPPAMSQIVIWEYSPKNAQICRLRTGSTSWMLASPSRNDSTVARINSTPTNTQREKTFKCGSYRMNKLKQW